MYKTFLAFALCAFCAGCASKMSVAPSNGKEDMLSSNEIFLASLLAASDRVPYSKKLSVNFTDRKTSLTKTSKKLAEDFAGSVSEYDDYEITIIMPEDEQASSGKQKSLSYKRSQVLFKVLEHSGIDKGRIDISFTGKAGDEFETDFKNSAVIDAQVW
ncbi:MAG: hypothetical protein FWC57_02005 [Endomicrobia bacterium]|nr:hypothetical protein [Endomicrobiia bacterium]